MTETKSVWDELCGECELRAIATDVHHPFQSGANGVALDLGERTVFVFEDPDDGYRSSATPPMIVPCSLYQFRCNPNYIRVPVLIRRWTEDSYGVPDGVEFIDRRNGKTILRLGTANSDDYYPSFTCEWTPANLADNAEQQS